MTELDRKSGDFSLEERSRLLNQYESSGLEASQFAKEHNINPQTLKNWIWLKANGGKAQRFSPVERKKMVEAYLASGLGRERFAETWGVSPATLSNWVKRYEEQGAEGLMNRTENIKRGMRTPKAVQEEIVQIKKAAPSYGIKKIKNWMYRFRGVKVSPGTVRKTITNEGLPLAKKPKRKKRSSEKVRRFERARPMQLWQSDITQFTLGTSGMRVYLTIFMDDHSRYIVGWRLMSRQTADLVMDAFKDAVVRFGKPEEVLTDQGRQYFAWRGKSELEKYLEKEGIKHVVSRAHHPQTLGKCERFWETVGNEFWTRAKPQDLEEARVRLKYFIDHYNHQRPHQGLDGSVPADRFFGVAEEVREIVEKTIEENCLRLSIGELPKPPAFLIGQVGEQRIAFHGAGGGFYLTNEDLQGEQNANANANFNTINTVSGYAINRDANTTATGKEDTPRSQDGLQSSVELPGHSGSWPLGSGLGNGQSPGQANSGDNARGLDWNEDKSRGGQVAGHETNPFLADEQSSHVRNDGRLLDATKAAQQLENREERYGDDGQGAKYAAQKTSQGAERASSNTKNFD